jgi:photosystem II stability/assembly factor-like uncharacterized protein
MNKQIRRAGKLFAVLAMSVWPFAAAAQNYEASAFNGLRWRSIGPHRGGRTRAVAGVPSRPNVFYMGVCNGGVWKTDDYGRTWTPVFDDQPTGSIGAIAVAPSDPNIVYVGCGEGLPRPDLSIGDGVYKSTDAGRTWVHLGLRDGQQIPQLIVDPRNPDRLFVAVLGHPYGPNEERGIFRSTDGGRTFQKVLYRDENTGGSELAFDPQNPDIVYAGLWETRQGPWENAAWSGTGGGLFKSIDGGTTWKPLTQGLPGPSEGGIVQVNLAVSPSQPKRLYAAVASRGTGFYRSDDAGESWTKITSDNRPSARIGGGDLPRPAVHPKDPDTVFVASTVSWKSTDGGKTWTGWRGAPGGDDYQNLWINPDNADIILLVADQGALVTVNGGRTWSSWYNQPTAQLYHVAADNAFPYRVYSGQQESGSVGISSRSLDGQITFRDWTPVGVDEYGYAAPDPLDPDVVYGGRGVTRFDRRTGQVQTVGPRPARAGDFRTVRTQPVVFSTVDPHLLFFASNVLWKTRDGGQSWQPISPDLTRPTWEVPAAVGKYKSEASAQPTRRGVIYTVAPSYIDVQRIWIGTDDGLIHVTADGGRHWRDVTPPGIGPWAKISLIDAGRFDAQTAYAAVNTIRLDDQRPHIFRTRDGGATWTEIVTGLATGSTINAVREDPVRKGLLFAAGEREVSVSFDDGGRWQSLRLNMPATSVRDLIVKNDDLVVATHGRGFWILDDITPLRQFSADVFGAEAFLFKPQTAVRVRWSLYTDTPLPPDEPGGENPPDGAVIHYALKENTSGPVTLEILDQAGKTVRRYSDGDPFEIPTPATAPVPLYWYRPPQKLEASAGLHRFLWDMHSQPLGGEGGRGGGLGMTAVAHNSPVGTNAPWVAPGAYRVKLTVNGKSYTQPITVKLDPRVKTPPSALNEQFALSQSLYEGIAEIQGVLRGIRSIRSQVKSAQDKAGAGALAEALAAFGKKAGELEGASAAGGGRRGGGGGNLNTFSAISASFSQWMGQLQEAEMGVTAAARSAIAEARRSYAGLAVQWAALRTTELALLNDKLKAAGLGPLAIEEASR